MPLATVVVDVPTAVWEKTAAQPPRGPWVSRCDDLSCATSGPERPLRPKAESWETAVGQLPVAGTRATEAAAAGRPHSSQSSGSNGEQALPPRARPVDGDEPPVLNTDTCVLLPLLDRKGAVDFSGRQLTALPCVHDVAAKWRHGSGSKAAVQARMLQLSHNSITSLFASPASLAPAQPIALAAFTKLVMLDVSRNELTSLAGVEQMNSLRVLQASRNKIEDLGPLFGPDSGLRRSAALRVLDVSFNQLRTLLPDPVDSADNSLRCVHTLVLSYNHLTRLSDLDRLFPDLLELRVTRNQIMEPPQALPKRISRLDLQQNYLDEAAQGRVRELQRRMRYLRQVDLDGQRTRQEVAAEADNTTGAEGIQGSESEAGARDAGEVHHHHAVAVDDGATENASLDTVGVGSLPRTEEEGRCGGAGQLCLREAGAQPRMRRAPPHDASVAPAASIWQPDLRWLEKAPPKVAAILACAFAAAALRTSSRTSHFWVQPRVVATGLTGALALIHEISQTELAGPCLRLYLGDPNRGGVAAAAETPAAPWALTRKAPCLPLAHSTAAAQGTVENVKAVEEADAAGKENAPPQQRQRGKAPPLEKLTVPPSSAPPPMPKRNIFTRGASGREWLIDELKAPLNWSETSQCHRPSGPCLTRRTKQERIDRRRKGPALSDAPQGQKPTFGRTVL
ncbi:putative leucine-rich repeat protein (LRRP) [Trypanosoma conorhini]|uniref:Putative leucine-rich repeat protein (LRRP) n=1 Tax=Trypanosoma conorhini TaxID=83891 RepID=A0A422NSI2_9TRYP|nr:putative leucine-rich repeat protein (LRRP) [Trypanosoma conorhini]RNF08416.1 putative leucine-rich repeat protein (LRRP) [Trypanosoma conorhini]